MLYLILLIHGYLNLNLKFLKTIWSVLPQSVLLVQKFEPKSQKYFVPIIFLVYQLFIYRKIYYCILGYIILWIMISFCLINFRASSFFDCKEKSFRKLKFKKNLNFSEKKVLIKQYYQINQVFFCPMVNQSESLNSTLHLISN